MPTHYTLVNHTRREKVTFVHIPAGSKRELAGNSIAAAISTWYHLEHPGDLIAYVSESGGDWPFPGGSRRDLSGYRDVTDDVVKHLVEADILRDDGREIFDENEPDVYMRRLRNVWMRDT